MTAKRPRLRAASTPAGSEMLRRQIVPLLAGYWAFGQFWGVWVILVFQFQRDNGISNAGMGARYTLLSSVAVLAMLLLAPRLQRLPLATSVPLSLASLAIGALAMAVLPAGALLAAFAIVGIGNGLIDVYLNVAAQRAELASRRPVLQWLHASYALGGVTGAGLAGGLSVLGAGYRVALVVVAVTLTGTAWWTRRTVSREPGADGERRTAFSISALFRSPVLWIPALIVLFAFLVEGSMDTWSGNYLQAEIGTSAGISALVFMAFSTAVFLGRVFAGRVLFGLGRRRTVLVSGVGSAAGGVIATVTNSPLVIGVAFLLLGFALSAAAPAAFGLVEASDEDATHAIAAVTTVGYTGFIWSPPLLGWVADTFSLRGTMMVIVIATFGIIGAGLLTPRERSGPASGASGASGG
jgi:predicted MFS family arabinose efflux permease